MKKARLSYESRARHCKNVLAKKLLLLMESKQTNLALSADVTSSTELLTLADTLGPEICILKTHIDILDDFNSTTIAALKKISTNHQFLIFEDRKFADIGNTAKQQYEKGIFKIVEWADIINAHSLPGDGIVKGLAEAGKEKQRGLLLLAEMSSQNNLFTTEYVNQTLKLAEKNQDFVIGFISQGRLSSNPQWIYMTPGIQFNNRKDTLGQQYITPREAIIEKGSDIIIVGRGVIHHENPQSEARKYREAGWLAYEKSLFSPLPLVGEG